MPAVEDIFNRSYSKGAKLFWKTTGPISVPSPITEPYIAAMTAIAGVKTIKGPKLGRDKVEMAELDQAPSALTTGDPLGVTNLLTTPAETREMYFNKVKAPGDKDVGPIVMTLNLTHPQYGQLHSAYVRDVTFVWLINLRVKAVGANTRCFFLGFGFISELSEDVQPASLVTVSCSIQPMFGVGYLSACNNLTVLTRSFYNFIPTASC